MLGGLYLGLYAVGALSVAPPPAVRVTQVAVEVFTPHLTEARMTQTAVEVFRAFPGLARPTQLVVEIFLRVPPPGRQIRRLRRAPHVHDPQAHHRITYARFALDLQRGVGALAGQGVDPQVTLRLSRDGGKTWSEPVRMHAGRVGAYTTRVLARRLGHARDAVFEVTVSDPIAWSLVGAWLALEPGDELMPDARLIHRLRRAPHVAQEDHRVVYRTFELDLERGMGLATGLGSDPQITLRVSRDGGETWSASVSLAAGPIGAYTTRAIAWRLGHARDAVFEVTVSDPIAWSLVGAWLALEPGTS